MATGPGHEIGSSGLAAGYGGVITEELHPNLRGREALKTWKEMQNDALVGAILFAVDMLVRQVEWDVEQKEAKEDAAEFLKECMDDMSQSWGDFVSEVMSMVPFGFAFNEIVYKYRHGYQPPGSKEPSSRFNDNKLGWRKLPLRAQETLDHWKFGEDGGIEAFVQRTDTDMEEKVIPMEKGLLFRTSVYKNNPEGRSLLRHAYVSWYYKKRIQAIEGTGIERDLAGFPVFWLPAEYLAPSASEDMKKVVNAFMSLGENIRRDKQEYLLMPLAYDDNGNKAFDFTLTASAGTRTFDLNSTIGRYNQEIAMSVLADFVLLGHENNGSWALSSDKTNLFATALGTILDSIADVMNRYAVPRLFQLNNMPLDNLPEIVHHDIEDPDLTALGSYLGALVNAGAPLFPDEDLEAFLRKVAGLPEKSEETKEAQEEAKNEEPLGQQEPAGGNGDAGRGQAPPAGDTGPVDLSGL